MGKRQTREAGEQKARRSRRDVLAGAAGAVGVLGAESLLGATAGQAGGGGDVVLGASNTETAATILVNTSASEGLYAQSGGTAGSSPGAGPNGVHGVTNSPSGNALVGENVGGGF